MNKYRVTYYLHTSVDVVVEANSKEQAIAEGYFEISNDDLIANLQEDDAVDVRRADERHI